MPPSTSGARARAGRDSIRSRSNRPTPSGSRSASASPASTTRPTAAAVWRTRDAGKSWKRLAGGLPRGARLEVLREGMSTDRLDPAGVYFGSTTGDLWASADEGKSWSLVAEYLPQILSVGTATLA